MAGGIHVLIVAIHYFLCYVTSLMRGELHLSPHSVWKWLLLVIINMCTITNSISLLCHNECVLSSQDSSGGYRVLNLIDLVCYYRVPGITVATDIICGFPTETKEVCTR